MKIIVVAIAVAMAGAFPAAGLTAGAELFPAKPVRIVVPNPPGGTVDLVARAIAQGATASLGQNVIVEAKPGGNTVIGTEAVARAAADGHSLLMVSTPFVLNELTQPTPYDALKDFAPVALVASFPVIFAVHPAVPASSVHELVALAKTTPAGLNYASFGIGQLAGEAFKAVAGIDLNFIPYQGGIQATLSTIGGHVPIVVAPVSDVAPHIASGKLRGIAVSSTSRLTLLPEVQTVAESGFPGFEWLAWIGVAAPARTPRPIIEKLAAAVRQAASLPETRATFDRLGIVASPMDADQFDEFIRAQMRKFDGALRQANIKTEK